MEGAIVLLIVIFLFIALFYVLGVRVEYSVVDKIFSSAVITFFKKLDAIFSIPVGINGIFCLLAHFFLRK